VRNTLDSARAVVPVRLSATERRRISRAAKARGLAFSSFVRWAALEAASDELLHNQRRPIKRNVPAAPPKKPEREPLIIEPGPEPSAHWVDGELVNR
jgi:Protein of unknown function (DUF1778)